MTLTRAFLKMHFRQLFLSSRKLHWSSLLRIAEGNRNFVKGARSVITNHDNITQDLNTAVNSRQVLDMVSVYLPQFRSNQIMYTLKILFNFQKHGSYENLIDNENFLLLCKKLKQECRSMEINDTIEALKILTYMGVQNNSIIIQALLQLIKHSVNELTLQHVIFLDFILRKFKQPTPLDNALLIALPLVFQLQIRHVIDHENINELIEYLQYASKSFLPTNCVQCIVSALTLHGEDLPIYAAKSIIWSLCDLESFEVQYERLLSNVLNILKRNIMSLSIEDIDRILTKIVNRYKKNCLYFYDEELCDKIVDYLVNNNCNLTQTIWILKKITRMSHANMKVLDYIGKLISEDMQLLSKCGPTAFFTTVAALSLADYKTANWDVLKKAILENETLLSGKEALPWSKCAVELASLDIYDNNLLKKIFSAEFANRFLSREFNVLDHFQLLHVHQAVKTLYNSYDGPFLSSDIINQAIKLQRPPSEIPSFRAALLNALGHEKYFTYGVSSKLGHFIDYVLVMNNGQPVPIVSGIDEDISFVENIVVPQNSTIICILVLPNGCYTINSNRLRGVVRLKIQTLEALHYKVLTISCTNWKNLDDREKVPYLLQQINYLSQ